MSSPITFEVARPRAIATLLAGRVMLVRLSGAALATAIATLLAVQPLVGWLPGSQAAGVSGLASVGLVGTGATLGGLLANSQGPRLLHRFGLRRVLLVSATLQGALLLLVMLALLTLGFPGLGILLLGMLLFVNAAGSPAISGMSRYWWGAVGLPAQAAKRGAALEPTFSAIAWSVGPVLAAPLVLLTPWMIAVFWALGAVGLLLLRNMPASPPRQVAPASRRVRLHGWWLPVTYAFYHIARALLNSGTTAILLVANQQALIGAGTAGPSLGHTIGGILFATRKDPEANLRRFAVLGLLGQATPTLLLAGVFLVAPQLGTVGLAVIVVGGGVLIGILKAPVAVVVYPLAARYTPHLTVVEATSMISNGMIVGGLVGPLLATLIITTVGAGWLLLASVLALLVCLAGFVLHPAARHQRDGLNESGVATT